MKLFHHSTRIVAIAALIAVVGLWAWISSGNVRLPTAIHFSRTTTAAATQAAPAQVVPPFAPGHELVIQGDEKFRAQVGAAVALLAERDPDAFAIITRYVGRIKQADRSGMDVDARPPTFNLADRSAYYSVTWCAGDIAHDSMHAKLYFDEGIGRRFAPIPDDAWTGTAAEQKCNAHQLAVLLKIGAPQSEIEYLKKLDGTHSDTNGDGKFDAQDEAKINW